MQDGRKYSGHYINIELEICSLRFTFRILSNQSNPFSDLPPSTSFPSQLQPSSLASIESSLLTNPIIPPSSDKGPILYKELAFLVELELLDQGPFNGSFDDAVGNNNRIEGNEERAERESNEAGSPCNKFGG